MPEEQLPQIHIPGVSDSAAAPTHTSVVHHVFILDASGSMRSLQAATITGFNEQVQNIRQLERDMPEQLNRVTLVFFNGRITERLFNTASDTLGELTDADYQPNGSTNLYGAIGRTLTKVKAELGARIATDRVIVTIQTDGENTDTDELWNRSKAKEFIEQLQADHRWVVTFIGANIDTEQTAQSLGIPLSNTASYTASAAGTQRLFRETSRARSAYLMNTRGVAVADSPVASFFSMDNERGLDLRDAMHSSDAAASLELARMLIGSRTTAQTSAVPAEPADPVQP